MENALSLASRRQNVEKKMLMVNDFADWECNTNKTSRK